MASEDTDSTVDKAAAAASITPFPTFDDGIEFVFRGIQRDEIGNPIGDPLNVTLTVPPLNFYNLKRLGKKFQELSTGATDFTVQSLSTIVEILIAALSQNYRNVPVWLIEQTVNPGNCGEITQAVMDVAGLKRKELNEKKGTATETEAPIGTPSSAT